MANQLEIYIDGASKGNPGHAGIGVVICRDGEVIENISRYIGEGTNNFAEYTALIYALQESLKLKADSVKIKTDSELLCRQINKEYKVRNLHLIGLYNQVSHLIAAFAGFSIQHIPREHNCGADKLATLAVKEHLRKTVFD
jgi:ribonuclease HI